MPREMDFSAYKKALACWSAKDRAIKKAFEKILSNDSCDSRNCTLKFRDILCQFYSLLEKPADFFISDLEWKR